MTLRAAANTFIPARPAPSPRFGILTLLGLARQRRDLGNLTDEQLEDIGISADEAAKEADRPFWDVPSNWLR